MAERHPKNVIVIAGVNGAGKTSWVADRLLTTLEISEFVNADEIARGLSPLSPQSSAFAAGRVMIERLHQLVEPASLLKQLYPAAHTRFC